MDIIKPSDNRFDRLKDIFDLYNYDNIICYENKSHIYYYIPPELIIREYYTSYIKVKFNPIISDTSYDNWIHKSVFFNIIKYTCNLSVQEYFDLLVLHINDTELRPKCVWCGNPVKFSDRVTWGYNQTHYWNKVKYTYCSDSCCKKFQSNNPELFPEVYKQNQQFLNKGHEAYAITKAAYYRYINYYGNYLDECYFYIALTDKGIKFGVTNSIDNRPYQELKYNNNVYKSIHLLMANTRLQCANLEAILKLKFEGREYLDISELSKFFKELKLLWKLKEFPNPFESDRPTD